MSVKDLQKPQPSPTRLPEEPCHLRIGKVAALYDISVQTLRYYDKTGLFSPELVDQKTNYRYYSIPQLRELEYILFLRQMNIPLEKIKDILSMLRGGKQWKEALSKPIRALRDNIDALQSQLRVLENVAATSDIAFGPRETVTIEHIAPTRLYRLRRIAPLDGADPQFSLRLMEERKAMLGQIPPIQTSFSFGATLSLSDFRESGKVRYHGILMDPGPYHEKPPEDGVAFPEGYYAVIRFSRDECPPEEACKKLVSFLTVHHFQADDTILELGQAPGFSSLSRLSALTELNVRVEMT